MILIEIVKNLWIAVSVVTCSMSVLKIQKQSPWGVPWKGVPKNYPNFIKKHLYQSLYRLEACNFTKKTPTRAYFRPLLHAVPAHNALTCTQCPVSIFADVFTLQKLGICMLFKAVSSLNLSFFIILHACPSFLKYPLPIQAFSGELYKVFTKTYFVEQLQAAASEKTIPYFANNFTQVIFS